MSTADNRSGTEHYRPRLRFVGRANDGRYHWESALPIGHNESRHEHISCDVAWFWAAHSDHLGESS